ncbi:MAG: TfoX/Sxy family protein [Pseudomonadota bacterium]
MKAENPMLDYVEDLFADLGRIRVQKMFGGAGIFAGEEMFALLDKNRIYLKTDDDFKNALERQGGEPFVWTNQDTGKTIHMSYVSMPDEALDDQGMAADLGRQALAVAKQARRAKVKSPRRRL